MKDSQTETALLRCCLALPKLTYVLRTCPSHYVIQATRDFDTLIRESLETIVGGPILEWSWLKGSLPSSRGGISLRSASLHAPAAYVASSLFSETLVSDMLAETVDNSVDLGPALAALSSSASHPDWVCLDDIDVPLHQRHLSEAIDKAVQAQVLSTTPSTGSRALVQSTSLPHADDWLNGAPSLTLGLHIDDREFRCCLR